MIEAYTVPFGYSGDAIVNTDGRLAQPPIALCEVQGYAYAAKIEIASLFERSGEPERAEQSTATWTS